LDEGIAPVGEAFGEVFAGDVLKAEDATGVEVFFAERGFSVEAGALVEMAVEVNEALGEGLGVVGVGVDDLVSVGGLSGSERCRAEGKQADEAEWKRRFLFCHQ
jgi:hypothetical protein